MSDKWDQRRRFRPLPPADVLPAPCDYRRKLPKRRGAIHRHPAAIHNYSYRDIGKVVDVPCSYCGCTDREVRLESSDTSYHWDGEGRDPNQPIPFCAECAAEHHEYWKEQWDDYYSGLL